MTVARRLEGEHVSWARAAALGLRAGVAHAEGDPERAARIFVRAEAAFNDLSMSLHALAMRCRREELAADRRAPGEAAEAMARGGVADPPRMVALLAPLAGV
jgi:hypothetical protein